MSYQWFPYVYKYRVFINIVTTDVLGYYLSVKRWSKLLRTTTRMCESRLLAQDAAFTCVQEDIQG
jgi:hypothetical protein